MINFNPESRLFIDGALVEATGGRMFDIINPVTEEVAGIAADASPADADRAIAAARRAFDETDWSTNVERRLTALRQLRDGLTANADAFRRYLATETGAPLSLTYGPQYDHPVASIDFVIDTLASYAFERELPDLGRLGMPARRFVRREAFGVVSAITPWNFPMQINIAKVIPALAAGCTVVLKPAPDTPWSATLLGRVAAEATALPPGVFNVITSSDKATIGEMMSGDPRIDLVSFTGSTGVGRRVMENASKTVKRVFLELGGKSAFIALDDADFGQFLPLAASVVYHCGQGCALNTRLLVPRSRYDEAIGILEQIFKHIPYGDPDDLNQIMGPLVNKAQHERVLAMIERGIEEGARLVTGGRRPAHLPKGYYVEPTLFADVRNDMAIAQEEIFGPVLVVIPFEDNDDAVRIANESIYGLSGAVVSRDTARAVGIAKRIRTGTIGVNGANFFAPNAPFGGYKQSGIGREMGVEGFEEYLQIKTLAVPS